MNPKTTSKTEKEAGVGSSALFGLWGRKGWRYRLLHWLCARWGYFPIPWDAVENADHDAQCAADEATADATMTNRAAAGHALLHRISAEHRELIMLRAGREDWARPNSLIFRNGALADVRSDRWQNDPAMARRAGDRKQTGG